jgi:hypothetical protein
MRYFRIYGRARQVTYILTYLLTPRNRVLLEKLTGLQLVNKFPAFYGTRRFITAFASARHCPYPEPGQSSPISHILNIHHNIILPFTPGLPKWSLSFRFLHQNTLYFSPLPHTCYMPRPSDSSRFYRLKNIG